jgi:hypothetical protein
MAERGGGGNYIVHLQGHDPEHTHLQVLKSLLTEASNRLDPRCSWRKRENPVLAKTSKLDNCSRLLRLLVRAGKPPQGCKLDGSSCPKGPLITSFFLFFCVQYYLCADTCMTMRRWSSSNHWSWCPLEESKKTNGAHQIHVHLNLQWPGLRIFPISREIPPKLTSTSDGSNKLNWTSALWCPQFRNGF